MKPSRNDPCPCDSGKKYKHCCLAAESTSMESPAALTWRRIRRALDQFGMATRLLRFTEEMYGPTAIEEAWAEFTVWQDEEPAFDPSTPLLPLFMPWCFHRWAPDPYDTDVADVKLHDRVPTAVYLERHGSRLDPLVHRYLDACTQTPFGFHEIIHCDPGRGFRARNLITSEEVEVMEQSASRTVTAHEILFGQLIAIDGIVMLECSSPFGLTPGDKIAILDLRDRICANGKYTPAEALRDFDSEIRELYLSLANRILDPRLPDLRNTDGDPLVPHKVIFDIDSPQRAFDALKHLAGEVPEKELLRDVRRGSAGEWVESRFSWSKRGNTMHGDWQNTVLGEIRISPQRLTCEVNSASRAETIRAIVTEALGDHARYRASEIQSIERQWDERRASAAEDTTRIDDEQAALMAHPEVRAKIHEMMAAHYERWVDEKIPALGGRTPLEAMRTSGGRERVEALLVDMERRSAGMSGAPDAEIFRRLRERVGLPPASD